MKLKLLVIFILLIGLGWRLYHIEFGLPQSFYADEPEFTELAIKYTYNLKSIIKNSDYYQLIPISYVYGTLPVYTLTIALMVFSKSLNILHISFDKTTIFIFFRVLNVLISMGVVLFTALLAKKHFVEKKVWIVAFILVAINWKLIVHAHYVNADIFLTLLLMLSFYWAWQYDKKANNLNLLLSAIFFGLAVGTKITALISLPLYLYLIVKKKDLYGFPGFIFSALISFIATNPFSVIFFNDFSFRIFSMLTKEGGMVFDSVDYRPFKYVYGLTLMLTLPIVLLAIYGIVKKIKNTKDKTFDIFLVTNIVFYIVFYSLQSRRVDRWLLPMLPLLIMYSAYGLTKFINLFSKNWQKISFISFVLAIYLVNPIRLLTQFQRWTPKSAAYLWANSNLTEPSRKLIYTEEGLDPMNKLAMATDIQFQVYVADGAQLFFPQNPYLFDYVIISSRPMENFKRPEVVKQYPEYSTRWQNFENTLEKSGDFELIKDFTLPKPNLIPLSDVLIYKNLRIVPLTM